MSDKRTPIQPNPPRWEPNPDPASIEVPGLDTSTSTHEQIEQIEQLITIKLQNIDENFSKMHHLLATKILPAVKRYAVGTEPVRDAARFWTSFYEQAAQIRIPTYEDEFSSLQEQSDFTETTPTHDPSTLQTPSHSHEDSIVSTNSEGSFMPGHDAFSSTPALSRHQKPDSTFVSQPNGSWEASLESPSMRLGRDLQKFSSESDDESAIGLSSLPEMPSVRLEYPTPKQAEPEQTSATVKGKGKEKQSGQPLLRNVLRHNLYSTDNILSKDDAPHVSPIKPRGKIKAPVPKEYNPYLSPDKKAREWNGIVDLNDRTITTPVHGKPNYNSRQTPKTPARDLDDDDDDDSFALPAGMSPPVMMSPARPARKSEVGPLKLGQTPKHDISSRITRNLLKDLDPSIAQSLAYEDHTTQSQASSMPTPPSLSRYNRRGMDTTDSIVLDSSLESMIRRVGLDVGPGRLAGTPGLRIRPKKTAPATSSSPPPPVRPDYLDETVTPQHMRDDSDSDSLEDEMGTTIHPSAAFLMVSAQASDDLDDSFESNHSMDSLNEDVGLEGVAPIHPFAQGVVQEEQSFDDDDDSFDYDEQLPTETLFGVPAAERMRLQQQQARGYRGDLRMLGEDLLDDTIGIGAQKAMSGMVEESPTPATRKS